MELSGIVPLPITLADNKAAAFGPLAGAAPLAWVVRSMLDGAKASGPQRIVVAAAEQLLDDVADCLAAHHLADVAVVPASDSRADCVAAGLEYLQDQGFPTQYVLVHHIRWPLTSGGTVGRMAAELGVGAAVVMPALPFTDSVKAVDEHGSVIGTLDRSQLQTVQYPRGFSAARLAELLAQNASDEFDELDQSLRVGVPITVMDGDPSAFAVDLPADAVLVEAVIATRPAM